MFNTKEDGNGPNLDYYDSRPGDPDAAGAWVWSACFAGGKSCPTAVFRHRRCGAVSSYVSSRRKAQLQVGISSLSSAALMPIRNCAAALANVARLSKQAAKVVLSWSPEVTAIAS